MRRFDAGPQPQSVNPLLKPVMIRGHNHKQHDKAGQNEITAVIPTGSVQRHCADDTGNEDGQAVGGEAGADNRSGLDEALNPADQSMQLSGP